MYVVYTITMTVGDLEIGADFYHSVTRPLCNRLHISYIGKQIFLKRLVKGVHSRNIYCRGTARPNLKTRLETINLPRNLDGLAKRHSLREYFKKKGRAIVTSSSLPKEESSPHQAELISPPDSPLQKVDVSGGDVVPLADWGPGQTALWLQANRYATHASHALSSYSGADLLRLSRDDLVQLCGLSDGIRLYNALHARTVPPRLTLYLMVEPRERAYRVVYLERWSGAELKSKVCCVLGLVPSQLSALYILGPSDIRLLPTDDLVAHLPDHSAFTITLTSDSQEKYLLIMKPSETTSTTA